jgi:hypothetical protein
MADNKKHHYVPRFYLRHFSLDDNSVNIFNIAHKKTILNAPFKHQCYKDYYYGRDQKLEGILSKIEGASARILASIIETRTLPQSNSGRAELSVYLMAQHGRTPANVALMKQVGAKLSGAIFEMDAGRNSEDLPDMSQVDAVAMSVCLSVENYKLFADLEARLIIAVPGQEFITSDTPVIFCNKFFAYRPHGDAGAPGWKGFQLFFPVSPTLMLHLFDPSVYNVLPREPSGILQLHSSRDMDQLNGLQIASAHENIFYSSRDLDISRLVEIFQNSKRKTDAVDLQVLRPDNDENRGLFVVQIAGVQAPLDLSFSKIRADAKKWRSKFQQQPLQPAVVMRATAHKDPDECARRVGRQPIS